MGRVSTVSSVSTTFELLQQKHPIRVELIKMIKLSKNPEHARVRIYSKTYVQKFCMLFWILLRTKSLDFSFFADWELLEFIRKNIISQQNHH